MKKTAVVLLSLFSVLAMAGCSSGSNTTYELAVVTDVGQLKDGGFNQGTYEGVQTYATDHNLTYKYYQPANGSNATDNDRITAYNLAVQNGAKVVVAPGFLQATAMQTVAAKHSDVKFVFVDGWALATSSTDNTLLDNVTAITYKEQESGYFAGYGAAMEGFTKLGGTFGGGGTNPACERYAWGYVQGIEAGAAAAIAADSTVTAKREVKISFKNGASFSASSDLQTQIDGWYSTGTQVVFCCGGSMVNSVVAAVGSNASRYIIGVDTDQSKLSKQVITSAMKGLSSSVQKVLGQYYAGTWNTELGGKAQNLGAADDATGLPTSDDSWRFKTFTKAEYEALFAKVKDGTVVPDGTVATDIDDATWWSTKTANMKYVTVTLDK